MPFGSEFWAAMAGAVIGGLIAFGVQMFALRAARRQHDEEHRQTKQALGHALLFKMINSNLYQLHRFIEEPFQKPDARNPRTASPGEPWQLVMPLAHYPERVHCAGEEMGMLLSLKDDALFDAMLSMDAVHNELIDAFWTFGERRGALTALLPKTHGADTTPTRDHLLALRPKIVEINALIDDLRTRARMDYQDASQVLARLAATLKSSLGVAYEPYPSTAGPAPPPARGAPSPPSS
jgi:hypothetical protein